MDLSWASIKVRAWHLDAVMDEGWHEHVWTITAWYPAEPWRDGRAVAAALRVATESLIQVIDGRRCFPPELWSNESIARRLVLLANVVSIDVERPATEDQPGFGTRRQA